MVQHFAIDHHVSEADRACGESSCEARERHFLRGGGVRAIMAAE